MDEPLDGLDANAAMIVKELLRQMAAPGQGRALLLAHPRSRRAHVLAHRDHQRRPPDRGGHGGRDPARDRHDVARAGVRSPHRRPRRRPRDGRLPGGARAGMRTTLRGGGRRLHAVEGAHAGPAEVATSACGRSAQPHGPPGAGRPGARGARPSCTACIGSDWRFFVGASRDLFLVGVVLSTLVMFVVGTAVLLDHAGADGAPATTPILGFRPVTSRTYLAVASHQHPRSTRRS